MEKERIDFFKLIRTESNLFPYLNRSPILETDTDSLGIPAGSF